MRRFLPDSGVIFLELRRPEDRELYTQVATEMQSDLKAEVTGPEFLVRLMNGYIAARKSAPRL
jgi:hypothetical protein